MLREISLANLAVVEQLRVSLGPGLNVLTGETGAGKSILVDAVGLLVGERAEGTLVRTGEEQALVEGVFDLPPAALTLLDSWGHRPEGGQLVVTREINRQGRNVVRLDGRPVSLRMLQELGELLVDIHGQSEHLSLLRTGRQRELLDRFASTEAARERLAARVVRLGEVRREMARLAGDGDRLAPRADLLAYQIQEIRAARLRPEEEQELGAERDRLASAEARARASEEGYRLLHRGAGAPAVVDALARVQSAAEALGQLDPRAADLAREAAELAVRAEELARALRRYRDEVEFSPARIQAIEERLELLFALKRKYGASLTEVLAYAEAAAAELAELESAGRRLEELKEEGELLLAEIGTLGTELSAARREAGRQLARALGAELSELAMPRARVEVVVEQKEDPAGAPADGRRLAFDRSGLDRVELLISTNPGEELRPLARIASGGEKSRLMLALKTILSEVDEIPTLVFDEIDQGIGGRTGAVVGQKLSRLAARHQVLCVTHLPQLAAFADRHLRVEKRVDGGRTRTTVQPLGGEEVLEELESMLGTAAPQAASRLLEEAQAWRQQAPPT